MNPDQDRPQRNLDEILGLDPEPTLSPEAGERLHRALKDARSGASLDRFLDADVVEVPEGLPERVIEQVRRSERDSDSSAGTRQGGRRWPLRLVAPVLAAAAALLLWVVSDPGVASRKSATTGPDDVALVSDPGEEGVSDELLASLELLEDLDYLTAELDPFEADALFLMSVEDELLFDLFESDAESETDGTVN